MNEKFAVLAVDDRPENLTAMEALLGGGEINLVKAASGNDALRLMLRHDFALVLLDVQMPEMDGFETAELMRANPKTRHLPIIFVTAGGNDTRLLFKGYELGAVDYLIKPFEPHILCSKVKVFCELHRQRRELEAGQRLLETKIEERVAQLRESEERFRLLAIHAPVGIYQLDREYNCRFVNPRWSEVWDMLPETAAGKGWVMAIHPDDRGLVAHAWQEARANGDGWALDYRLLRKDGKIAWVHDKAVALRDRKGALSGYLGNSWDITARKREEDWEGTRGAAVSRLAQGEPLPAILADIAAAVERQIPGRVVFRLREAGAPAAALAGEPAARWSEPIRSLNGEALGEIALYRSSAGIPDDGEIELFGDAAQLACLVIERRRAEDELKAAKAEAERANNAKSRFLAAASHDLRQPLSALNLYLDVLQSKVEPAKRPLIGKMRDCAGSLSELLTDLLDLSKLDAGVVEPSVADFAIGEMMDNLVSVHAPEAALKGLRLRCVPSVLVGRTDPLLLRRMLGNLLSNALRYTERGSVLMGCRRRRGKVWIEVWDTGIGIPNDKLDEVFEEFKQIGTTARNRGSGLGLAIVAKSAALLGLQIRVESWPGRGSMFAIELPLGSAVRRSANREVDRRSLRIALVEDNAVVRQALVHALSSVGHELVAAGSGRELHALLDDCPPDIVVSDYRLADHETGFDVIESVRSAYDENLPAVLITGDTDPGLMRSMANRGIVVQYKPLDIEAIQVCMAGLMQERNAPRSLA